MSRRHRVPGTPGDRVFRVEVATAGRPVQAYLAAVEAIGLRRGELWLTDMHHDDGCPGLEAESIPLCTCEIVEITARRVA